SISAYTVHGVIVRFRSLAIHTELTSHSKAGHSWVISLGRLRYNPRREQDSILEAAPIQWHVLHISLINYSAHCCRLGVNQGYPALHSDRVRNRTHWKGETDCFGILNIQRDVGMNDRLESLLGHPNVICARRNIRHGVDPLVI